MSALEENLLNVTTAIEKNVDAVIEQFDNLGTTDLEHLRINRLKELKSQEEKKKVWLSNDHGKYEELAEEKMFFDVIKKSENVIIHFYRDSTFRCAIFDKHLKILAPKHVETRFTKLNAEKCPFLVEKLRVKTIPTIVLIQNGIMIDKIVGFTQLGNCDDFTTEVLEWRIAQNNIINYDGDLSIPPNQDKKSKSSNKKIRDGIYNRDDDDLDAEEDGFVMESLKSDKLASQTELTPEEAAELGLD